MKRHIIGHICIIVLIYLMALAFSAFAIVLQNGINPVKGRDELPAIIRLFVQENLGLDVVEPSSIKLENYDADNYQVILVYYENSTDTEFYNESNHPIVFATEWDRRIIEKEGFTDSNTLRYGIITYLIDNGFEARVYRARWFERFCKENESFQICLILNLPKYVFDGLQ